MRRQREWAGPIGSPNARHAVLVAELAGRIVGFASVGPTRDDDGQESVGEVRVVNVDAAARERGIGSALVTAGEESMRTSGFTEATLWVVPQNEQAIRCYERCGWRADGGERVIVVDDREIPTIRYRKRLAT